MQSEKVPFPDIINIQKNQTVQKKSNCSRKEKRNNVMVLTDQEYSKRYILHEFIM